MAFTRTKRIKGILYRYRVESVRRAGKVQQHVLEYLGRASSAKAAKKAVAKKAARKTAKATGNAKKAAVKKGVRGNKKK